MDDHADKYPTHDFRIGYAARSTPCRVTTTGSVYECPTHPGYGRMGRPTIRPMCRLCRYLMYRGHIHSKLTEWMTPNNEKKIYNAIIFMKIVLILITVNLNCK